MDGYREHPSDFDISGSTETDAAHDVAAAIGTDERRMHVRAYNHWVSLLDGRDFPSIEDLEPSEIEDFATHSVLLDFTCGRDNPAIPYIGADIREECGLEENSRTIADVPSRSLLSRLTDHYMQIIANRAPIGFEAEFVNPRGANIGYRGILMPFSSDGDAIDFIYGVINWKTVEVLAGQTAAATFADPQSPADDDALLLDEPLPVEAVEHGASDDAAMRVSDPAESPLETDPPSGEDENLSDEVAAAPMPRVPFAWELAPDEELDSNELPETVLDENAGLADRLWAARETADNVKAGEGRTRVSLYRALSLAYDFAVASQQNPDEYSELLEESGMKAQARAPMTPIVKLVFGIDYDKARLTEFAAALSYAHRQDLALGAFQTFIEGQAGGLKALVAAERAARRPDRQVDRKDERARARLRSAPALTLAEIASDAEFAVVITRRSADGSHEPVAVIDDEKLLDRAIRSAA